MAWTKYFKKIQMTPTEKVFIVMPILIIIILLLLLGALVGAGQVLKGECDGNLIVGEDFTLCVSEAQNEMFVNAEENQYDKFETKNIKIALVASLILTMASLVLIILGYRFISNYLDEHFVLKTKKHNISKTPKSKYKKQKIPKKIKGK